MKCKQRTQAEALFSLLRRRSMTYMDLLSTGISVCPWKRMSEEEGKLLPKEKLKRETKCGRVVFRVVKAAR